MNSFLAAVLVVGIQAADPDGSGLIPRFAVGPLIRSIALVVFGIPVTYWVSKWVRKLVGARYSAQGGLIAGKVLFYPLLLVIVVTVLMELGFSLAPLLGAAGVLGIALGFASQTSVSNVISGLFLIGEQPFVVDDLIQVGATTGRVLSVDTLSVKLRTFDNRFVRIPNESIIKSEVINFTRFPIRRIDAPVGIAYKEDVQRVRTLLLEVADKNPRSLLEPEPQVWFDGLGDSSVNLRLTLWAVQEDFHQLRNVIQEEIKARLDAEEIEIPFPHRTLYTGLATDPLPIRIMEEPSTPTASTESAGP